MSVIRGLQVVRGGWSGSRPMAEERAGYLEQGELAGLMDRLLRGILSAPEDGEGRIAVLRQSIGEGSYQVPAAAVADKIMERMWV